MRATGLFVLFVTALIFAFTSRQTDAQDQCPVMVEQALNSLSETCSSVSRNSVCYGYNVVSAIFNQPVEEGYFSKPSDQAELVQLSRIYTTSFDINTGQWGLALMNVQANIPDTLPGQGVIFILMGSAEVQNLVSPDSIPKLSQRITLTVTENSNLRSAPDFQANVLGVASIHSELPADMISEDGEWLRVLRDNVPLWVHHSVVRAGEDLNVLPRPRRTHLSPMQAFRFTTGVGQAQCQQAQDALIIQGPNNVVVDIEANGAVIQVASTIMLTRSSDNRLNLTTLSGRAYVDGLAIPAGYTASAPLGADGNVQAAFTVAQPLAPEKLEQIQPVESIQPAMMHYRVDLPTSEEIRQNAPVQPPAPDQQPTQNGTGSNDINVPGGENGNGRGNKGVGHGNGGGNGTGNEGNGGGNGNGRGNGKGMGKGN